MSLKRGFGTRPLLFGVLVLLVMGFGHAQDVPFLESPEYIVEAMLDLAEVNGDDIVYDLGSGDGRIVIAAAATRNARAVGIESDPELITVSNEKARDAGVEESVTFVEGDFFETDFSDATVVAMYLYPDVNRKLKPVFVEQLAPGTRIVSHRYEIGGWTPVKRIKVGDRSVFLYVIPEPEANHEP